MFADAKYIYRRYVYIVRLVNRYVEIKFAADTNVTSDEKRKNVPHVNKEISPERQKYFDL